MLTARICIVAAAILGLNACRGGEDVPLPSPVANATPVSAPVTSQPAPVVESAPLATAPVSPAAVKITQVNAKPPAPLVREPKATTAQDTSLTLDLNTLEKQLKETKAIGLFSKIALKNQVDDLVKHFREYYQGKTKFTLAELHQSYDLLMLKVLSLLQDEDQKLASAIVSSRDAIWNLLSDPKKFASLDI